MKKVALCTALILSASLATTVQAHPEHSGYLTESVDHHVSTGFGGCWKIGNWNQGKEDPHCGGKPAEPVAEVAPAPVPAPAPVVVKPAEPEFAMKPVQRTHIVFFDFNSSKAGDVSDILDSISSLTVLDSIRLVGHTDLIGSNSYNQNLARKRVDAVAAALTAGGVEASKIDTLSRGENAPAKSCADSGNSKSCLAVNRRVEVTINGQNRVQTN